MDVSVFDAECARRGIRRPARQEPGRVEFVVPVTDAVNREP